MKRTIVSLIAAIAAAGVATTSIAQTRHDERPHGYYAKVATEQRAQTPKVSTFATGPRPHDAVRRVAKARPDKEPTTVANKQEN